MTQIVIDYINYKQCLAKHSIQSINALNVHLTLGWAFSVRYIGCLHWGNLFIYFARREVKRVEEALAYAAMQWKNLNKKHS